MMLRFVLITLLLSLPLSALSNDHFSPEWKASCDCGGVALKLSFSSPSGDPTEDDMVVKLISSKGKEIIIPVQKALYVKRSIVSDVENVCNDIGGFKLKNNRILLWLSRNDRPRWDQLSLVLIDLNKLKVIDIKEDIGPIKSIGDRQRLAIRKKDNGFEVRLEREWMENTGTDSAENSIEDWMFVQVINNKITNKWSR
jgi:hypothetical protein